MHFTPVTPHGGVAPPPVAELQKQEREQEQQQLALWQQQQWLFKQLTEQQQPQLHPFIIPPGSAHHPAFSVPVVTSHGHAPHSVEPMAFTFNPEEVAAIRSGPVRVEHLAGMIPPGQQIIQSTPVPLLDNCQLVMGGRLPEEHGGGLIPLIQAGVPASVEQQQMMAVQQQQIFNHIAAVNSMNPHELMESLRQAELLIMQVQKEPGLLHDPTVQVILNRREVLMQQIMAVHQRVQQEALIQQHHQHQELLQKQQQQQFILARPPHPEEVHSRNRPGVIVGHK